MYNSLYDIAYKGAIVESVRLDQDVRPLSEFRASVAAFVRTVADTRRPLLLTQHGRGVVVVVDVRDFEDMRERLALLEAIARSRAEFAAGGGSPHADVMKRLREATD